jgi:DNA polymerase (family X)
MDVPNQIISKALSDIGEYLEMQNIPFKPRAYEKAAEAVAEFEENVIDIYKSGGIKALQDIPGVGLSIAEKIEEFIKTGHIKYYDELRRKTPVELSELTMVEGLGPKKIKTLYQKLGIRNIVDLEKAANSGKIAKIDGFGKKTEENILKGICFVKRSSGRFVLGFAMPEIQRIEEYLKRIKAVDRLTIAGSVRRRKETIGDIDILIVSNNPKEVMDRFVDMPGVQNVFGKGETKSSVKIKQGMNVDLRVVGSESYGAALNYFTGSKDHNVALRGIAIKKGLKLNEYGLYKASSVNSRELNGEIVAGRTEEELYKALGMDYIEPEMRENTGEIELAQKHKLPKLVGYDDLEGDLQVQTNWTDGSDSIESMTRASAKHGLKYIAITDHTKRLAMTHGLDETRIQKQWLEIDRVNKKLKESGVKCHILKGTECDILKDGSLDLPDNILSKLDVVGASVHSYFNLTRSDQTTRIKRAMTNPNVDVIFHPSGRLIKKRDPYDVDMEEIIKVAKQTGTVLEIDSYPDRLDLKDEYIRKCVQEGVKMSIDSDAHSPVHFSVLEYGVAQARRGWAERRDIINAWPLDKMLKFLKT